MAESVPFFGNFNFLVEIEDLAGDSISVVGGFSEVGGLVSESEVVEFRVGNSPATLKFPGRTHYSNVVLRRGCTVSSELSDWRRRIENGENDRRSGSVILLDSEMQETARWNFFEAWPCRYEAPKFNAADTAVSIETLELCVERIERVSASAT